MLKRPFSRRQLLEAAKRSLPGLAWGIPTAISAWSLHLQTDAGQQRANRPQGRIVETRAKIETHSSLRATIKVAHETDTALPIKPVLKPSSDRVTIPI